MRSIGLVRRAYQLSGWGLVLLGTVHMATTFWAFDALSGAAVWFFGSGIAMALTGVLNLLNDTYGGVANGLRWTCIGTNVAMTAFAVVAGVASRATVGQVVIVFGLVAGAAVLSAMRRPMAAPASRT